MAASMAKGTCTKLSPTLQMPELSILGFLVKSAANCTDTHCRCTACPVRALDRDTTQSGEFTWRPGLSQQHLTIPEQSAHLSLVASTSGMTGSSIMSMCASFLGYLKVSAPQAFSHQISHLITMSSHRMIPLFLLCTGDTASWPLTYQWKWQYAGRSTVFRGF